MELVAWTEPQQGASYEDLLAVARAAEASGLDGFFRSDHFLRIGGAPGEGLPGPSDAWITLAGLARETSRIRLGTLVSPVNFRLPGPLAIAVANVDAMSGGRVELGLGAGWYEREHEAYGIPFLTRRERFDRLEEQLLIVRGLWETPADETFSFAGEHYRLVDAPGLPKPVQRPGPPIVIGGGGTLRTPGLVARHAAEYNVIFGDVDVFRERVATVHAACEREGRDPATLRLSIGLAVALGETEADARRRAEALAGLESFLQGTPEQVAHQLRPYLEAGASRVYLQLFEFAAVDEMLRVAGERLRPLVTL